MKNYLFLASFSILFCSFGYSQNQSFRKTTWTPISKIKTINIEDIQDDYLPAMAHLEAPDVSGHLYRKYLHDLKQEIGIKHPKNYSPIANTRGDVDPPEIGNSFIVSGVQPGIPLDNHLAMSDDVIVSGINSFISIQTKEGGFIKNFSLLNLADELAVNVNRLFDPRLLFDPTTNRYVAVFLAGVDSNDSNIVICFSATSDPNGEWHAYSLPGNPNNDTTWTDYPMIQFTETDIQITINLLRDGESWQLGFEESLIWQLDKADGYAGEDLGIVLWDDINYEGAPIRNLCPVESGTEVPSENAYYLSDRNFSVENDTFFILELTGGVDDPDSELIVDFVLSDIPYGVPPNATQQVGQLQTNDARVLEAFIIDDQIQFVGNTRNLDNNQAGIFHGILNGVTGARDLKLTHIIGDEYEIGYPGITYTGDGLDERDAIIAFNHTSNVRYAGLSAMYFVEGIGYSDIITIKEGANYVDMLGGTLERWGDYLGTQRDYNNPDDVWVAGFHGLSNNRNHPWIAQLSKPRESSNVEEAIINKESRVFPNPLIDRFSVEFNIPESSQNVTIELYSMQGLRITELYNAKPKKTGKSEFSFSLATLVPGTYLLKIKLDNNEALTKKIIVH